MVMKMVNVLKKFFQEDISCKKLDKRLNLPLILARRESYRITMGDISFVAIKIRQDDLFSAAALKKQLVFYEEQLQCNVAYVFDMITRAQRDSLIKNKIPFISLSEQVYLPFLGIILNEKFKKEKEIKIEKMMPATQQLFLYLLYQKHIFVLKGDAADALGLTRTSITRASEQLLAMGLIEQEKKGKEIRMFRKYEPDKMYEAARPYLINPVQEKLAVKIENIKIKWLSAGESALSEYSMLNPPNIADAAIYKGAIDRKTIRKVDIRWEDTDAVIMLELWKYDPFLFSKSNRVDPISLACSLADCEDERVEMAIDEMLEGLEW